jgi:hypothetical protein
LAIDRPLHSGHEETCGLAADFRDRLIEGQRTGGSAQSRQERGPYVVGPAGAGKDFAARFHLRGHALGLEQIDDGFGSQGGQRRMEEAALFAKRLGDAAAVGGVGQIAAGAAGEQDFAARLATFFEQKRLSAALGRPARGHEPGGSPAHDNNIPR